jgi:hypothetical protein
MRSPIGRRRALGRRQVRTVNGRWQLGFDAVKSAEQLADADPAGGRKRAGAWPGKICENGWSDA